MLSEQGWGHVLLRTSLKDHSSGLHKYPSYLCIFIFLLRRVLSSSFWCVVWEWILGVLGNHAVLGTKSKSLSCKVCTTAQRALPETPGFFFFNFWLVWGPHPAVVLINLIWHNLILIIYGYIIFMDILWVYLENIYLFILKYWEEKLKGRVRSPFLPPSG